MNPVRQALFDRLTADAPLAAIVAGRIYHRRAPEGAAAPYVVFHRQAGTPRHALGDGGQLQTELWTVKAVAQGGSSAAAEDAADAIDNALHDAQIVIAGRALRYLRRESDIDYGETAGADTFHHVGAVYRLWTD